MLAIVGEFVEVGAPKKKDSRKEIEKLGPTLSTPKTHLRASHRHTANHQSILKPTGNSNHTQNHHKSSHKFKMSYLFGNGRPQPSSAEKIAAAETEIDMVSDMFNR